jgi:hypothetical protein
MRTTSIHAEQGCLLPDICLRRHKDRPPVIGDLNLLEPSTNYPPVTKRDDPIALSSKRVHSPEKSWAAQHVEVDFAAQLTSHHEFGFVNRDQFLLTLRPLGSPWYAVT